MTVYTTCDHMRDGNRRYYHNEYRTEGEEVVKYICHQQMNLDDKGEKWLTLEESVDSWNYDDPDLPELVRKEMFS